MLYQNRQFWHNLDLDLSCSAQCCVAQCHCEGCQRRSSLRTSTARTAERLSASDRFLSPILSKSSSSFAIQVIATPRCRLCPCKLGITSLVARFPSKASVYRSFVGHFISNMFHLRVTLQLHNDGWVFPCCQKKDVVRSLCNRIHHSPMGEVMPPSSCLRPLTLHLSWHHRTHAVCYCLQGEVPVTGSPFDSSSSSFRRFFFFGGAFDAEVGWTRTLSRR